MTVQRGNGPGPTDPGPRPKGAAVQNPLPGAAADDVDVPDKQLQRWVDDGGALFPDASSAY
jgi:hypothetical protein